MKFYLPTYKECKEIVELNPHGCFYERRHVIDDYEISIFSYRHAKYNNFILPLENSNVNALELKGLTFVFEDNNTSYRRYLMLHKFWEIDQYEHSRYELFKDNPVKNITIKEDGFLVSFIKLPNGTIISNTKTGFNDYVNYVANKYLDIKEYYDFINNCIDSEIRPIFELVFSNSNRGIVNYTKQSLILTKLRCNKTGTYLNLSDFDSPMQKVGECHKNLSDIYDIKDTTDDIEGWIVHFENDEILKVKTKWWRVLDTPI